MSYAKIIKDIWPDCDLPAPIIKALDHELIGAKLSYEQVVAVCTAHSLQDEYAQKNPKTPVLLKRVRSLKSELAEVKVKGKAKDLDEIKENLRRAEASNTAAAEWLAPQIEGSSQGHLLALMRAGVKFTKYGEEMFAHALDSIGRRIRGKHDGFDTTPDAVFVEIGRRGITCELVCTVQPARILVSKAVRNLEAA